MRSLKIFIYLILIFGFSSFAGAKDPSEIFSGCSKFSSNGYLGRVLDRETTPLEQCLRERPGDRADSHSCTAIACAAYYNADTLQSWTDNLKAMQPPKAADFEKKRDFKKAKQAYALGALNLYYVKILGRHDQIEKGVFGSICARDLDLSYSGDTEFDCDSRKFSYENAENIRIGLLEAIEPRLSSLRRTAAIEDKYKDRSPFWSVFYQQWWSDEDEFDDRYITYCEFPELNYQEDCKKSITYKPVSQKDNTWSYVSLSWLLARAADVDNNYSGSDAKQIFELGSKDYEVRLANVIDFYDNQLGGILDQLISFAEWEDTDVRARYLRSTYSEKRRKWLCESIFDETAEAQRALIRTSTTNDLDFCDATALWSDLANSVALDPGLLKAFKFSERWIPAKYLSYDTDSYETASLNTRYDFALKHGSEYDRGNLKSLVRSLLSHISLSVLFTSQSYKYRYDYSAWREKLEKLANDFYFEDISSEGDIEKRVQLATYTEEHYEFLAFLANANTQREKSIFAVYEKLTSSKGLSQAAEYRQTLEQYGEKSIDYSMLGFCKARQGDAFRYVTDPLFNSLAEDFAVYRATVAISEEDKDKIDSNALTRVALFWPEDDSGMGRECDRVIESIRDLN